MDGLTTGNTDGTGDGKLLGAAEGS
jgi:hypothetical protein